MDNNTNTTLHLQIVMATLLMLLVVGTFLFHYLENWTYIQSFYFSVTTITTVGYWDIVPSKDTTRLAVSIYIMIAVTLYISTATVLWNKYLENTAKRKETLFWKYGDLLEKYTRRNKK